MSVMAESGDNSNQGRQRLVQETVRYEVYERKVPGGKQKQMVNY